MAKLKLNKNSGFTLIEVLVGCGVLVLLMSSLAELFVGIKSTGAVNKGQLQAMEVVRGEVEALKDTAFGTVANSAAVVTYDAGADGVFGTADDLTGNLTVTQGDFADMDNDGNTAETAIDVNGDLVNDATRTKPLRVSFTWTRRVHGQNKNFSYFVDVLIAR